MIANLDELTAFTYDPEIKVAPNCVFKAVRGEFCVVHDPECECQKEEQGGGEEGKDVEDGS